MLSQCQQIKKDYEELRVLKEEFDLEYDKKIRTRNLEQVNKLEEILNQNLKQ